jgi:hypothetical protein
VKYAIAILATLLFCGNVSAEYLEGTVTIESKTVSAGKQDVTVEVIASWNDDLAGMTIPLVVRELDPGSFWTGDLPYDTGGNAYIHPYSHGVAWHWSGLWATFVEELRPGVPENPCGAEGDLGYDGLSPDHLCINAAGAGNYEPAEPDGRPVLTMTFAVTEIPGQFEFDTACFSGSLGAIYLIGTWPCPDCFPIEIPLEKGIITITDCVCTTLGDCNGDAAINPVDVMYLVNTVYRLRPAPPPIPWCPAVNGDWNCDDAITPLDVAEIAAFVYRNSGIPPCNPCTGGRKPDLALATEDILFNKSEIEVGEPVWIGLNVHNLGPVAATNVAVAVYAGDPDSGGQLLGSAIVSDIPANQSRTQYIGTFTFDVAGPIDIHGLVDGADLIDEVDEENNQALRPLIVE